MKGPLDGYMGLVVIINLGFMWLGSSSRLNLCSWMFTKSRVLHTTPPPPFPQKKKKNKSALLMQPLYYAPVALRQMQSMHNSKVVPREGFNAQARGLVTHRREPGSYYSG